jgi:hypothetical protein
MPARRSRSGFASGMFGTLLVFLILIVVMAHTQSDCGLPAVLERLGLGRQGCSDDIIRVGFPLVFWEEGGFAFRSIVSPFTALVDLLLAVGLSAFVGWRVQAMNNKR